MEELTVKELRHNIYKYIESLTDRELIDREKGMIKEMMNNHAWKRSEISKEHYLGMHKKFRYLKKKAARQ